MIQGVFFNHAINEFFFVEDPLWLDIVDRQLCLHFFNTMHLLQETGSLIKKVCWVVLEGHKEEAGGPSLAEERKEQLEQLPPPIDILDPPFDQVVSI